MASNESEPLLPDPHGNTRYGSNSGSDGDCAPLLPTSASTTSNTTNQGSCGSCINRLRNEPDQCKLLVINLLILVFAIFTAGLMLIELQNAYGQCIIGMPLYEGGLLTQGVQKFWCRCPLYTVMLTSTVAWISIMINWVSDLRTKKCAFAKWTKWQFILTLGGSIFTLCAFIISVCGFGKWCERVRYSDDSDIYKPATHPMCFEAARQFDDRFSKDEQFVKLVHTFWYTLGITIFEGLFTIWWIGADVVSFRLWRKGADDLYKANYAILTRNDANDRAALLGEPLFRGERQGEQQRGEPQQRGEQSHLRERVYTRPGEQIPDEGTNAEGRIN